MERNPSGIRPSADGPRSTSDPVVAEVERLLAEERWEDALERAEQGLRSGQGDVLDLTFLAGDALLWLGDPAAAEARFRHVLAQEPTCPSSRCWLAMALYRQLRFEESESELALAMDSPEALPDCHVVRGLLLERHGEFEAADAAFSRAAELDPDRYFPPVRLARDEFDTVVVEASERLPEDFRRRLQDLPVIVQDVPSLDLLAGDPETGDPDLLGLFVGPMLGEETDAAASYIYLFQRNLERHAGDLDTLRHQIAVTLYHELGHYLGFEEDDLDEIGLG